jgi:tetratricopeptide (TPR) repeat protein
MDAPTAARARLTRDLVDRGAALHGAGHFASARAVLAVGVAGARALAQPALLGEAVRQEGNALSEDKDPGPAEERYHEAARLASEAHDDALYARTLRDLGWLFNKLDRVDAALVVAPLGEAAAARAGDERLGADLLDVGSAAYNLRGDYPTATAMAERALAIHERLDGKDSLSAARSLNALGNHYDDLKRFADARAAFGRALAIWERAAPDHPTVASLISNLGVTYLDEGRPEEGRPYYLRAVALRERIYGPDHPAVAALLNNLALITEDLGDPAEADRILARVVDIDEKTYGPDNPYTLTAVSIRASEKALLGELDAAAALAERAVAGMRKSSPENRYLDSALGILGQVEILRGHYPGALAALREALDDRMRINPDDADSFLFLVKIGDALRLQGQVDAARAEYQRGLALIENKFGPGNGKVIAPLVGLARCDLAAHTPEAAIPRLIRALSAWPPPPALDRTEAHLLLAAAVAGRDPAAARAFADEAARGPATAAVRAELAAFQAHHGRQPGALAHGPTGD